ncbi:hypothetical protein BGY98DRAFT_1103916 [Russula aff. rugulosa BPL654]|nr:hypothetical protein BGY98DRAFT_1103916 [Russula aff. rugulosa BPL654]
MPGTAFSREKTPTLALVLPTYEALVVMWKELAKVIPELSHYVVINPSIKLKWIEEYWLSNELADAERWMEEVMLAHCRARRLANVASQPAASRTDVPIARNGAPAAVVAQARGFANFTKLSVSSVTEEEKATQEAEDQARDLCTVRNELRRYKEEPPPDDVHWILCAVGIVALDVLPVQASAVLVSGSFHQAKRHVFSEVLQVLKHLHKEEHIDFTSYWMRTNDYSVEKATTTAINELRLASSSAKHEHDELLDLLHSMDNARIQ